MNRPRIYLVRHGETDWNAEERLLSFTDRPLSERGERQVAILAGDLSPVRWDRAYASPLRRARRTAELVLAARPDAPPLVIDDRLREMDFGPYEGWSESELEADPLAATRRRDGAQIPGVEPEEAVAERARSFLASLGDAGGTTLIVGHGRMLRILLATALGLPPSFAQSLRMRNCRPAVMEPGARPLLLAFNAGDPSFEVRPAP
ncbi:MAG TPA: histidine phosphatase family protein [Candidatus Sulfotelmatobacter sp.]|nr:histidine phosphatase family protein [Candidatus Sulfotelmatobacter sp.]